MKVIPYTSRPSMKIAVIVTGHARNYRDNYLSIQHCLAGHDVDIYISTWSVDSPGRGSCGQFALTAVDLKPLLQLYQPQAMHVEDHDSYYANRLPAIQLENAPASADIIAHHGSLAQGSFWVERIRDMYATIKRGYDLIQDPDQYDLIMRIRFDAVLKR
jgi:hypothetical protein